MQLHHHVVALLLFILVWAERPRPAQSIRTIRSVNAIVNFGQEMLRLHQRHRQLRRHCPLFLPHGGWLYYHSTLLATLFYLSLHNIQHLNDILQVLTNSLIHLNLILFENNIRDKFEIHHGDSPRCPAAAAVRARGRSGRGPHGACV
jgi:hypothetical protein